MLEQDMNEAALSIKGIPGLSFFCCFIVLILKETCRLLVSDTMIIKRNSNKMKG